SRGMPGLNPGDADRLPRRRDAFATSGSRLGIGQVLFQAVVAGHIGYRRFGYGRDLPEAIGGTRIPAAANAGRRAPPHCPGTARQRGPVVGGDWYEYFHAEDRSTQTESRNGQTSLRERRFGQPDERGNSHYLSPFASSAAGRSRSAFGAPLVHRRVLAAKQNPDESGGAGDHRAPTGRDRNCDLPRRSGVLDQCSPSLR